MVCNFISNSAPHLLALSQYLKDQDILSAGSLQTKNREVKKLVSLFLMVKQQLVTIPFPSQAVPWGLGLGGSRRVTDVYSVFPVNGQTIHPTRSAFNSLKTTHYSLFWKQIFRFLFLLSSELNYEQKGSPSSETTIRWHWYTLVIGQSASV